MKYHKQKHLQIREGDRNIQTGSCYPTVIACLLDLELDQVPNFQLLYFDRADQRKNLEAWLKNKYLSEDRLAGLNEAERESQNERYDLAVSESHGLWDKVINWWLASEGYETNFYSTDWVKDHPGVPYLVSGISPRGVQHVVIYQDGKMIHDPHPDGGDVTNVGEFVEVIEPIKYLKDEQI